MSSLYQHCYHGQQLFPQAALLFTATHSKLRAASDTVAHGNDMIVPNASLPAALYHQLLPDVGITQVLTAGSVTRAVTLTAVLLFQQCMLVKICPFKLLIARQHGSHQCS